MWLDRGFVDARRALLLRCEHDDLAVLLTGARDLDLAKATWPRGLEVVRHVLRQHEHQASAAEHLTRSALRCQLDREADTRVDDRGEDPAVLLNRVARDGGAGCAASQCAAPILP